MLLAYLRLQTAACLQQLAVAALAAPAAQFCSVLQQQVVVLHGVAWYGPNVMQRLMLP
jgi:hypothetical protein